MVGDESQRRTAVASKEGSNAYIKMIMRGKMRISSRKKATLRMWITLSSHQDFTWAEGGGEVPDMSLALII